MNQSLQIRYVLLQVQLLLQYNTDSNIKKLAKLRRCLSRVLFGIHFEKYNVLNVFRSCYLNRWVCNFFLFFSLNWTILRICCFVLGKLLWLLLCKEICHIRRLSGVICLNYTIKENIFPLLKMAIQCVKQFHGQTLQARLTCKAKKMWKPGTLHNHTLCRHTLHKHTLHKNTLCRNTLCKNTFRRNTRWKSKSESCWS